MRTTITIRADEALHDALVRRAEERGTTISAVVREILEASLSERPMAERVRHLSGTLRLREGEHEPWRKRIRHRNWRP